MLNEILTMAKWTRKRFLNSMSFTRTKASKLGFSKKYEKAGRIQIHKGPISDEAEILKKLLAHCRQLENFLIEASVNERPHSSRKLI